MAVWTARHTAFAFMQAPSHWFRTHRERTKTAAHATLRRATSRRTESIPIRKPEMSEAKGPKEDRGQRAGRPKRGVVSVALRGERIGG
jgi:hypothetical protein